MNETLRLIWTDDPGNTYRQECGGKVVGILIGFDSFMDVPDALENELIAVLRKYSNAKG